MAEMHYHNAPYLDDYLFHNDLLDLNPPPLDLQYSTRLMTDYPLPNPSDPMAPTSSYADSDYIHQDSQLLSSSIPIRSDSAQAEDIVPGQLQAQAQGMIGAGLPYSGDTSPSNPQSYNSQSSLQKQSELGYMDPTAMVDQVLESTLSTSTKIPSPMPATVGTPSQRVAGTVHKQSGDPITSRPDEIPDGLVLVNTAGNIVHCNFTITTLLGQSKDHLVGLDIRTTLHPEDINDFHNTLTDAVACSRKFKTHARFSKIDESGTTTYELFEVIGTPYSSELGTDSSTTFDSTQSECRGIVLNCRPYPSPQAAQFDGFLQLSSDNLWLRRQLHRVSHHSSEPVALDEAQARLKGPPGVSEWVDNMMNLSSQTGWSPSGPESLSDIPVTQQQRPDLHQFYYPDESQKHGLVASAPSTGSNGSAKPSSKKDKRSRKPTSKTKEGEYICTECGTMSSPEWRKGPQGRKTLCNACGLRWSKQTKKQQQQS